MKLEPVQTLWVGPINDLVAGCLSSFVAHGHDVHLYCYEDPEGVPEGVNTYPAAEILTAHLLEKNALGEGRGSYAAFSDLFRFTLLLKRGGWWVDADVFCLRPFDADTTHVIAAEHDSIGTCVIRAPAGSPILEETLKAVAHRNISEVSWTEYKDEFASVVLAAQLHGVIRSEEVFCPIPWNIIAQYVHSLYVPEFPLTTVGVHLWNEIWRREDLLPYASRYLTCLRLHTASEPDSSTGYSLP